MPVGEVALAPLGCLLDKVFGGFGRFWRAPGGFGGFWRVWRASRVLEGGPTGQVPHLRCSQAPPRPWRRPGSADIGEKYVQEEFLGEESLGEKYMGEKYVQEEFLGEESLDSR